MSALSIKDFDPASDRRLAWAAVGLAVLGIAWTLFRYAPGWLGDGDSSATQTVAASQAGGAPDSGGASSLADYPLFGQTRSAGQAMPTNVEITAPETALDLVLRGTVTSPDPEAASAIIADPDGRQKPYRVGDELPGGATLHRVYPDRVILRLSGELETLSLRDPANRERAGDPAGPDRAIRAAQRGDVAAARQAAARDPAAFARNFQAQPVRENGELVGVRLQSTGHDALLSRVGLRSTDVVTSVNGIPLNDMSRAGEVMSQLQTASEFQVTVIRNGREEQINVSLN